jgi:3,4-dihydroxy-2-butanone 4-phosphate synthase
MVANNTEAHGTAFTVSVDYKHGTTTGISASDRCKTIRALANPKSKATDFDRPGHIFPLRARKGGVLTRPGHTETSCDLARLAGLTPIGVLSEITNIDGSMARTPDLVKFSKKFGLKMITIADLISYRQAKEGKDPKAL